MNTPESARCCVFAPRDEGLQRDIFERTTCMYERTELPVRSFVMVRESGAPESAVYVGALSTRELVV